MEPQNHQTFQVPKMEVLTYISCMYACILGTWNFWWQKLGYFVAVHTLTIHGNGVFTYMNGEFYIFYMVDVGKCTIRWISMGFFQNAFAGSPKNRRFLFYEVNVCTVHCGPMEIYLHSLEGSMRWQQYIFNPHRNANVNHRKGRGGCISFFFRYDFCW